MVQTTGIRMDATSARDDRGRGLEVVCPTCLDRLPALSRCCPRCPGSLLRAAYSKARFEPGDADGLFRYLDWLPPTQGVKTRVGSTAVPAPELGAALGLDGLHVGYNGYAPELGAFNPTASFKDFEALPTLLLLREHGIESVLVASAGNTARAFAYAGVLLDFRVHIVVPERMLHRLWIPVRPTEAVHVTVVAGSRDYFKAIELGELVVREHGLMAEGGARNVARRDGMGTSLLEFARVTGAMPDHYVQAVGSGTGGIAAWEAAERLRGDGRFGTDLPRLHLAQNAPFTPIHDAWTEGAVIEPDANLADQLARIDAIDAEVLANRNPPYGLAGGVRDALRATDGRTYAVTNEEAARAGDRFRECMGVDVSPAAAVACGALEQAVRQGTIGRDETVLLNITGGGDALVRRDHEVHPLPVDLSIPPQRVTAAEVAALGHVFGGGS
jgi:cysteate synthase